VIPHDNAHQVVQLQNSNHHQGMYLIAHAQDEVQVAEVVPIFTVQFTSKVEPTFEFRVDTVEFVVTTDQDTVFTVVRKSSTSSTRFHTLVTTQFHSDVDSRVQVDA
jgi:biotin synthase-related radical SAM superfamily protein